MASNKIQLTESELHELVNEAVQQILIDEGIWDSIKGGASALGTMAKRGFNNGASKFQTSMNDKMQRFGNGVKNAYNNTANAVGNMANNAMNASKNAANAVGKAAKNAKNAGKGVYDTMKAGALNANIQSAKNNAIKALDNFLQVAQKTKGVVGDSTLIAVKNCIINLNKAGGRSSGNLSGHVNSTLGKFGLR